MSTLGPPDLDGNCHLNSTSPCRNAADPGWTTSDYDADLRDSFPDIGADEFNASCVSQIPPMPPIVGTESVGHALCKIHRILDAISLIFAVMSQDDQLKLLEQFSACDAKQCSTAWEASGGHFWRALHQLSLPDTSRKVLLARLDPSAPKESYMSLLELRRHFRADAYLEAWMRIEDEDLQASYIDASELFLPLQEIELLGIVRLLENCRGGDVIAGSIQLLYDWQEALPERAVVALLHWVEHYDPQLAGAAIRVFVEFPDAMPEALPVFRKILEQGHTPQRYDVAWTLWTLAGKGHHFSQLREAYHRVAYLGTATEQHFMRKLLEKTESDG